MIGQSQAFLEMFQLIEKIKQCDAPVLIEGETGTGKELVANAIHSGSARKKYPFIPINCGAIPDDLIENELFGHKCGAYTGAHLDNAGLIAQAQHGTLFLDEIDTLSPKAQVTLLRFLQDQIYQPLGGGRPCQANVRVVVASNVNLEELVEQRKFRQDLLYRLKIMSLKLPPLRERYGDVAVLATHFLRRCTLRFNHGEKTLHPETIAWFDQYAWPGNIRELENLICREYLLEEGNTIFITPLALSANQRRAVIDRRHSKLISMDFNEAKNAAIAIFEHDYLTQTLIKANGNVTKAAQLAGKERRSFGKLLKKYGVDKQLYCQ
ncbi:MAG: sigma-54 dependent transcriptional regulator [Candidatus Nitrotoga sp.]